MKGGTSATEAAISSSRPNSAGVSEAPTATPSTGRIASETVGTPTIGIPASAAARQANIGPSSSGRGIPATWNSPAPAAASASVASRHGSRRELCIQSYALPPAPPPRKAGDGVGRGRERPGPAPLRRPARDRLRLPERGGAKRA